MKYQHNFLRSALLIFILILTMACSLFSPKGNKENNNSGTAPQTNNGNAESTATTIPDNSSVNQNGTGKGISMGIYRYETSKNVDDGLRLYTLYIWIRSDIAPIKLSEVDFGVKYSYSPNQIDEESTIVTTDKKSKILVVGHFSEYPDDMESTLIPGIAIAGTGYTRSSDPYLQLEFKVPFDETPQKLVIPNYTTEIVLPKINPDTPYKSNLPNLIGKTIPYGETVTVNDLFQIKVTTPKLIELETANNLIAVIDVITSTTDQSNFSFEVQPQLSMEDGTFWNQPLTGAGYWQLCGKILPLDYANGEYFNSELKINSGKETHNWYCFATKYPDEIYKTLANFTIIINDQFMIFSGKPE